MYCKLLYASRESCTVHLHGHSTVGALAIACCLWSSSLTIAALQELEEHLGVARSAYLEGIKFALKEGHLAQLAEENQKALALVGQRCGHYSVAGDLSLVQACLIYLLLHLLQGYGKSWSAWCKHGRRLPWVC
jgi:hypothetical protein